MLRLERLCLFFVMATALSGHIVTEVFQVTRETLFGHLSTISHLRTSHNGSRVADYIMNTFTDIASMDETRQSVVLKHEFLTTTQVRSMNLVLLMKGSRWGSIDDRLSILGSHYDHMPGTTGINDNGSGMAALLEIARLLMKTEGCHRQNSILIVAFDAEEVGLEGSRSFVNDYLIPEILEQNNISVDAFHGAYIMDTIMNYDKANHSQTLPARSERLFPEGVEIIKANDYRGDFLAAIGRDVDVELLKLLSWHWNNSLSVKNSGSGDFHILPIVIPKYLVSHAPNLMRSDHYNFWNYRRNSESTDGLKAVFLTDSGEYRGFMKECYHKACDDMSHVNQESLHFLAITTHTLRTLLLEVSAENKHCYGYVQIEYLTESRAACSKYQDVYVILALAAWSIFTYTLNGDNRRTLA